MTDATTQNTEEKKGVRPNFRAWLVQDTESLRRVSEPFPRYHNKINSLSEYSGKRWRFFMILATRCQSAAIRRNPPFSFSDFFALWQICGKIIFLQYGCENAMVMPIKLEFPS